MWLEPGDVQIINSHVTLHSRSDFTDHEEASKKRLLFRPRRTATGCRKAGVSSTKPSTPAPCAAESSDSITTTPASRSSGARRGIWACALATETERFRNCSLRQALSAGA